MPYGKNRNGNGLVSIGVCVHFANHFFGVWFGICPRPLVSNWIHVKSLLDFGRKERRIRRWELFSSRCVAKRQAEPSGGRTSKPVYKAVFRTDLREFLKITFLEHPFIGVGPRQTGISGYFVWNSPWVQRYCMGEIRLNWENVGRILRPDAK
eukprot:COSAG04_NODE_12930_length_628_cov_0.591682_1_plen_152_part_00